MTKTGQMRMYAGTLCPKKKFGADISLRSISEVLQSEFLSESRESLDEREAVVEIEEKIVEQELLLEFLLMLQQRKQEAFNHLRRDVSFLSSDLQEVTNMQVSIRSKGCSSSGSRKRIKTLPDDQEKVIPKSSRIMKNFKRLETAYNKTSKPDAELFFL